MLRALFACILAVSLASAHNILLPPYGKQCFFEKLNTDDELLILFQVGSRDPYSADQYTVDFTLLSPSHRVVASKPDVDHGDITNKVTELGKYVYCFSNERLGKVDLDVSFNVHGMRFVDPNDPELETLDYAISRLSELTEYIKDEQSYLVIRERTHRNTAESTNLRVKWWSIFQIIVVMGNSLFQVYYLRRFFEVKLVV